jgi:ArsR family metal-binding transcriptional regulator
VLLETPGAGVCEGAAEEGLTLLAAVRDLLNQTWTRRDEIQPRSEGRNVPRPLDVYELLPRTNCRACGEATCIRTDLVQS